MPFIINNICGFETGGDEEASFGTIGTPEYEETAARTGEYALRLTNSAAVEWAIDPFGAAADGELGQNIAFYVRFAGGLTPSSAVDFFASRFEGAVEIKLTLDTNGDLIVGYNSGTPDTISTPFTVDTWHRIELYFDRKSAGAVVLDIDDTEVLNTTLVDTAAGGVADEHAFMNSTAADGSIFIDDYYTNTQTAPGSFLGDDGHEVFAYQANTDSAAGDSGDSLDVGVWQNCGKTPGNSDDAQYTAAGVLEGYVLCNDTVSGNNYRPGPSGGVPTVDGLRSFAKWLYVLKRGSGAATNHYQRFGNSVDTPPSPGTIVALSNQFANYVTSNQGTTIPVGSETFAQGFGKASGSREIMCQEMWAFLLHRPPPPPAIGHAGRLVNAARLKSKIGGGLV